MKNEMIIPCPFCGNKGNGDDELRIIANNLNSRRMVFCEKCGAKGPAIKHEEAVEAERLAVEAWNTRV